MPQLQSLRNILPLFFLVISTLFLSLFLYVPQTFADTYKEDATKFPYKEEALLQEDDFSLTFYDGTDYSQEYPDELRAGLTWKGKDITLPLRDGRVLNISKSYWDLIQKIDQIAAQDSDSIKREIAKEAAEALRSYAEPQDIPIRSHVYMVRENPQTGKLNLVLPHAINHAFIPGDIIYKTFNYKFKTENVSYSSSSTAPFIRYARFETHGNKTWDTSASSWFYIHFDALYINGEKSDAYKTFGDQYGDKVTYLPLWNKREDGPNKEVLLQYQAQIPNGPNFRADIHENFLTTGGSSAGTLILPSKMWRLPEIQLNYVLVDSYKQARQLEAGQEITARSVDEIFSDLQLQELEPPYYIKDLLSSNLFSKPGDTAYSRWVWSFNPADIKVRPTIDEWDALVHKEIPGYLWVGTDVPYTQATEGTAEQPNKITFHHSDKADKPEILLRKHFYSVYKPLPRAIKLTKKDANTGAPLEGAGFELWNADKSKKLSETIFTTDKAGEVQFFIPAESLANSLSEAHIKELPTSHDGVIALDNDYPHIGSGYLFEAGSYYLKEVKSPKGYQLPQDPYTQLIVKPVSLKETQEKFIELSVHNAKEKTPPIPTDPEKPTDPTTPVLDKDLPKQPNPQDPTPLPKRPGYYHEHYLPKTADTSMKSWHIALMLVGMATLSAGFFRSATNRYS